MHRPGQAGFTLIELLAVITVVGVLAGLLFPVLSKAKGKSQSIGCVNNLNQLQTGWLLYVHDNNDALPANISRKVGFDQVNVTLDSRVPWVLGNAKTDANTANIQAGALCSQVGSARVYYCPSDRSFVAAQPSLRRTRSYSIHEFFNCDVISYTALDSITDEPDWNIRKYSRIVDPGPSRTWVFIDEHETTIDDGILAIGNPWYRGDAGRPHEEFWNSLPASRHDNGANLSFADGHVESHSWKAHRNLQFYTGFKTYIRPSDTDNLEDLHWLQDRIPHAP